MSIFNRKSKKQDAADPSVSAVSPDPKARAEQTAQNSSADAASDAAVTRKPRAHTPPPAVQKAGRALQKRANNTLRGFFVPFLCAAVLLCGSVFLFRSSGGYQSLVPAADSQSRLDNAYFSYLRAEESRLAAESIARANAPVELGDSIISRYAIMIRCSDGRVMCEKNADEKMYPASITKLMTVLVVLDRIPDPDSTVYEVTPDIINYCISQNASRAGFLSGEHVTVTDLLYATVLPSGAEAALTLAQGIAGTEQAFAELMNQKAASMGLTRTHFTNVTGLHDDDHYTTVRDLCSMVQQGLSVTAFRELVTTMRHSMAPTDQHPKGFTVYSTIHNSMKTYNKTCEYIVGGKTGYTPEAGQCLASVSDCMGDRYIIVTGNAGSTNYAANHIQDADSLLDRFVVNRQE